MPTIRVERSHSLSRNEARTAAEKLAQRYEQELGVTYRWQDDMLHFEREGVSGRIHVSEDVVRVIVELGEVLGLMQGAIRQAVEDHLDDHLSSA